MTARFARILAISMTLATVLGAQSSTQTTLRNPPADAGHALLVTFGIGDKAETGWDGDLQVRNGELVELIGYEMGLGDVIHPPRRWEMSTRPAFPFDRRNHDEDILVDLPADTYLTPRFYVYLNGSASTEIDISTEQGDFSVSVGDVPAAGTVDFLDGRASVSRVPIGMLLGRGDPGPPDQRLTDNDFASLEVTSDDSVWVAFSGFANGSDRVYADRILPGQAAGSSEGPHAVSPANGDVYRTAVAEDAEGKVWVLWSEQVRGNWDLYARAFDGEVWGSIERLTAAAQPDIHHKAVRDPDGTIHLVWQGARDDRFGIFHRSYDASSGWGAATRVSSASAGNCWEPSITSDSNGTVYVAWDQYSESTGYDVYLARKAGRDWDAPRPVARTGRFEAYVTLAADRQDRVWMAWHESGINWGKDWGYPFDIQANATGLYNSRNIRMAVYDRGQLRAPATSLESSLPDPGPGNNYYEYPQLAVDGSNRIWAFFRHRRPMQHNVYWRTPSHHALWEIYASYYDGDEWSPMMLMPYSTGRTDMRIEAEADSAGRLIAAYPTDRRSFRDFVNIMLDVFATRLPAVPGEARPHRLTALSLPPAQAARQPPNRPSREMAANEPVHPNDEQDVARIRSYVYDVGGKRYKIYRGDMHRHTEISWDGYNDGSTEDTYRYAIDPGALDFLAITEHNFGVADEYDWFRSQKFVDIFRVGSAFVPLYAYERSIKYPNGHRNVVFPYRGAPILDYQHYEWALPTNYARQGPERFFAYLRKYKGIAMAHTSGTDMGTDWADYDPEVEPIVEIYQSDRNSYECEGCWRSAPADEKKKQFGGYRPDGMVSVAWAKGYRLGVQASSDHLAVHTSYSMLLAEENSRTGLVDAIRARHTYGATDNIIVDFRLAEGGREYLMGEEVAIAGTPTFRVHVEGTDKLGEIEIVKNNQRVYRQTPGTKTADFEYQDKGKPGEEADFYYLRVRQSDRDRQVAWSSPIWVTAQ